MWKGERNGVDAWNKSNPKKNSPQPPSPTAGDKRKSDLNLSPKQRTKSGNFGIRSRNLASHLDPKVYLDGQSKGLASRIVKYHDESRSRNLYQTPGDLPIVHLKRNELLLKNRRSNSMSNLRIGRPDFASSWANLNDRRQILQLGLSAFSANRRPSEPNVMAPLVPVDDEFSGTRSVLDALKEISRKRINRYDESELETKKYCRDVAQLVSPAEVVDGRGSSYNNSNINHNKMSPDAGSNNVGVPQKRHRDHISPPSQGASNNQQKYRRMCGDNYDVINSLSSSVSLDKSGGKTSVQPALPQALARTTTRAPVRELPESTRPVTSPSQIRMTKSAIDGCTAATVVQSRPQSDANLPLRPTASAPIMQLKKVVDSQPTITLFSQNYDKIITSKGLAGGNGYTNGADDDEDDDNGNCEALTFVKPAKGTTEMPSGKEVLKKIEKNKLAMMLKCLAGDFEDSDEETDKPKDMVDTAKTKTVDKPVAALDNTLPVNGLLPKPINPEPVKKAEEQAKPIAPSAGAISTTPSLSGGFQFKPTVSPSREIQPAKVVSPEKGYDSGFNAPTAALFKFDTPPKPIKTQSLLPASTVSTINLSTTTPVTTFNTTASETKTTSSIPAMFSFSPTSAVPIKSPTQPSVMTFGKSGADTTVAASVPFPATTTPTLNLGSPATTITFSASTQSSITTTTTSPSLTHAVATPPAAFGSNAFSFGSGGGTATSLASPAKSTANPQSVALFGNALPTTTSATTSAGFSFGAKSPPTFSFGGSTAASSLEPVKTTALPNTGITFGKPAETTTPSNNALAPTTSLGFGAAAAPTKTFSFGGTSEATKPPTAVTNAFSFGGATTAVEPAKTFTFGSTEPTKTTSPSFAFGATSDASKTPSFQGFGTAAATTTSTMPAATTPNLFALGSQSTGGTGGGMTSPTAATTIATPSFGSSAAMTNSPAANPFGSNTTNQVGGFGLNKTTATSTPVFGGFSTTTTASAQPAKPATNIFGFGQQQPGATNSASPALNFGSGAGATAPSSFTGATSSSVFGASAAAAPASSPFGGSSNYNNNTVQASPFGGGAAIGATTGFGGLNATGGQPSPFGAPAAAATGTAQASSPFGSGAFGGGGGGDNNKPIFGASAAPAFGQLAATRSTPAAQSTSAFQFGAGASSAPSSTFSFGSNAGAASQSPAFGFGQAGSTAAPALPSYSAATNNNGPPPAFGAQQASGLSASTFNFNGATDPNAIAAGNNPFSVPANNGATASGQQQQQRKFRTASRRLR